MDQVQIEETTFSFSSKAPQPPAERRKDSRFLRILRVGSLIARGKQELCLIRNISAGGLMAQVYSPLDDGERVAVELKTNTQLAGTVIWVQDDGNVGIEFDQPMDVEEMLSTPAQLDNGWVPRMPRVEVDWLATVRVGAKVCWVTVRDISQGGVKFESDQTLQAGQQVVLTIDKFRAVPGVVRWYADGVGGIAFNELVPFNELMKWLRTS